MGDMRSLDCGLYDPMPMHAHGISLIWWYPAGTHPVKVLESLQPFHRYIEHNRYEA